MGIATGVTAGEEGGGSEKELRQRAQRARLSAGVACLWAGIGVGAMLCGKTAEATSHYAENAREAIKGCYDVVSEEVGSLLRSGGGVFLLMMAVVVVVAVVLVLILLVAALVSTAVVWWR